MTISQHQGSSGLEQCRIKWHLKYVGDITLGDIEFKIKMPKGIPKLTGGVYQILASEKSQHYVGESDKLFRRFYYDYQSSGYHPDKPKSTNRRVVEWIYGGLPATKYEVYICTDAQLCNENEPEFELKFNENKYHRLLVESIIISSHPELGLINL